MPILNAHSVEVISRSPEQTRRVGMRLGALLAPGDVICLVGDLGSGKTTFVQGVASGWGSLDQVTSPTFVIVNLYRRPQGERFYHLDGYRLSGPEEAKDLDIDSLVEGGPLIVEWADRIKKALPAENLWVSLRTINNDQRDLIFSANGERYQSLLEKFRKRVYGSG